jgi:WD40 repeat protein
MVEPEPLGGGPKPARQTGHDAFISYSRADRDFAVALETALEAYRPPHELQLPNRYLSVFRDEDDFTGTEYTIAVKRHLRDSRKLIVICSPAARASRYVAEEIRFFGEVNGSEHIIPVLLAGIANNEGTPGREAELAFPDALCDVMPIPLAASYRGWIPGRHRVSRGQFESAWLTILANLCDVERSVLEQRERRRQIRFRHTWMASAAALVLVFSALTVWGLRRQRDAADATERERDTRQVSVSRALVAEAERRINQEPRRLPEAVLLAVEALHPDRGGASLAAADVLRHGLSLLPARPVQLRRKGRVSSLVMSPDGNVFATLSRLDGALIIGVFANDGTGRVIAELPDTSNPPVDAIAVGPQGRYVALVRQNSVALWEPGTQAVTTIAVAKLPDTSVGRFSSDGRYLALITRGGAVLVRDMLASTQRWLNGEIFTTLAFSSNVGLLALARTGRVVVFDPALGDPQGNPIRARFSCNVGVTTLGTFSHDGRHVAVLDGTGTVHVFNVTANSCIEVGTTTSTVQRDITALAVTPSGRIISMGGSDGTARLWNVADRSELARLTHASGIASLDFDGTGQGLITTDVNGAVSLWSIVSAVGTQQFRLTEDPIAVGLAPDATSLTTVTAHGEVLSWPLPSAGVSEVKNRAFERLGDDQARPLVEVASFSPGSNYVAMLTTDGLDRDLTVVDLRGGTRQRNKRVTDDEIDGLSLRADGRLAALLMKDNSVQVVQPGARASNMPARLGVSDLAFEPAALRLAMILADQTVTIADPMAPDQPAPLSPPGAIGPLLWSAGGEYLATVTTQQVGRIWDVRTGKVVADLPIADKGELRALSPDARFVATLSGNQARLWEVRTATEVSHLKHDRPIKDIKFSHDGRLVATVSEDRTARVWLWNPKDLVDEACRRLPIDTLPAEDWRMFVGSETRRPTCTLELRRNGGR